MRLSTCKTELMFGSAEEQLRGSLQTIIIELGGMMGLKITIISSNLDPNVEKKARIE